MFRFISLAALCLAAAPVHANGLAALQAGTIDVGGFHGIVYYTQEHDGYRVVATISNGETGLPIRFEATLTEGQKLSISVPGNLGEQSQVVQISRATGMLVVAGPQETVAGSQHTPKEIVVNGSVGIFRPDQ